MPNIYWEIILRSSAGAQRSIILCLSLSSHNIASHASFLSDNKEDAISRVLWRVFMKRGLWSTFFQRSATVYIEKLFFFLKKRNKTADTFVKFQVQGFGVLSEVTKSVACSEIKLQTPYLCHTTTQLGHKRCLKTYQVLEPSDTALI